MVLMQRRYEKTRTIFVSVLLLLSLGFFSINLGAGQVSSAGPPPLGASTYVPHDVIRIEGDAQFLVNATAEGWTGDGSAINPFVISGYSIDAHGAYNCIFISNVSYHIVIKECDLFNTTFLGNVWKNGAGIFLQNVTGAILENNVMLKNTWVGFNIVNCTDILVRDNVFRNITWTIDFVSTNNSRVVNNSFENCTSGLIQECFTWVLNPFGSNNNIFENNTCVDGTYGYISWLSPKYNNTIIRNNEFHNFTYGVYAANLNYSAIQNNNITECTYGIYSAVSPSMYGISNSTIENNTIRSMKNNGMFLDNTHNNVIHDNLVADSATYGMNVTHSSGNVIYRNVLMNKNDSGAVYNPLNMQAFDDSNNNTWFSSGGEGNYWSDWTTPDANHDGIVDVHYPVGGGNTFDYFPLTTFLEPPTDLLYTTGQGWVDLEWNASARSLASDVLSYRITRTSGAEVTTILVDGTLTTYNDTSAVSWKEYDYYVEAISAVGESAKSSTVTVLVPDETPPSVDITSPANDARLNSTTVEVIWTGIDHESGIASYSVKIDGGAFVDVGTATAQSFTTLSEGSHTVSVKAFDNATNNVTVSVTFTVDTVDPTVMLATPSGNNIAVDSLVVVTFSEAMKESSLTITVSGGVTGGIAWVGNVATFSPSADLSYDTMYVVIVQGTDLAGNHLASYGWTFNTTDMGWVSGIAVDDKGNPIAGANVTLSTGEHALTGSDGKFSIQAHPGAVKVTIKASGYDDKTIDATIVTGEIDDLGNVQMTKPFDMTLIIVLIIVVVAAVAVLAYMMTRRKK